ncbi:MAG TPA: hypothetical protein VHF22_00150, partial [Planctomycetota bacterium]|nr:hypothetical protein [Planctomycetota bacterium]
AVRKWFDPCPTKDANFVLVWGDEGTRMGFRLRKSVDLKEEIPGIKPAVRGLDVTLLHKFVLERGLGLDAGAKEHTVSYVRWESEGLERLKNGTAGCMLVLKPTSAKDVLAAAEAGAVMPQKSTDFYPKLLSGLIMNDIEDPLHGE